MAQRTTLKEFEAVWPKLEDALLEHAAKYKLPKAEAEWYKRVRYSLPFPAMAILSTVSGFSGLSNQELVPEGGGIFQWLRTF